LDISLKKNTFNNIFLPEFITGIYTGCYFKGGYIQMLCLIKKMKFLLPILLLIQSGRLMAFSFPEIPLNLMIERAEFICKGQIIKLEKTDSILQQQLRDRLTTIEYGDPHCGFCTDIATFVITKEFKGGIKKDTIQIAYHFFPIFLLPGFNENREYILFLNKIEGCGIFTKTDPRFGVKSSNLDDYEKLISEYLTFNTPEEKRKWILKLCINPEFSWESMINFRSSSPDQFTDEEKEFLTTGLIKMDFDNDYYTKLLELVQEFGENDMLIIKCFNRLSLINELNVYEGLDLMQAINAMDPKPEYKDIIHKFMDGFNNKLTDTQKLELVKEFIKTEN
jgi:hypothetical protein